MEIAVRNSQRSIKVNPPEIKRILAAALMYLSRGRRIRGINLSAGASFDPSDANVSVLLVGDNRMRALNLAYRGIDKTTDVLSFSQLEGIVVEQVSTDIGDIVINPVQAARQAADRGIDVGLEMRHLLVHGLLHLIGYDHEKDRYNAMKMRKKEKELLNALEKMGR
ncbi:MAG TPA: rRNA maturation RNase YbeY [Dissulfurispiraceae bacterium]|nr:rRNA maturation RNase YbeY [Dissulfurispiraceae bacterium]